MRSNSEVIDIIKQARKDHNLSISELARRVDMPKSSLSRYESKKISFPIDKVDVFAKVLDLSPEFMIGIYPKEPSLVDVYSSLTENNKKLVYDYAKKLSNMQHPYKK